MKNWKTYKVIWTKKEFHSEIGEYEGAVCQNYIEAPSPAKAWEFVSKSEGTFAVKSVQLVDTMARLQEIAYEAARA